ncbi:MAG: GNAT family N-acetyltransferase [Rickettsiales bacterium]|nr:GNAT family N-acetyltransferase [Rickettsiales bacterium]
MAKDIIIVRQLDDKEMMQAFNVVRYMYDKMSFEEYEKLIAEMVKRNDYKMIGAFMDDKLVGVAGYWIFVMLYCKRYVQVSNLVVDPSCRGKGIGKKILRHIINIGKKSGCEQIVLDSYSQNKRSHSLYFKEGYYIRGFHFMKNIK